MKGSELSKLENLNLLFPIKLTNREQELSSFAGHDTELLENTACVMGSSPGNVSEEPMT